MAGLSQITVADTHRLQVYCAFWINSASGSLVGNQITSNHEQRQPKEDQDDSVQDSVVGDAIGKRYCGVEQVPEQ